MSSREERVARNESTTREINEGIEQAHQAAEQKVIADKQEQLQKWKDPEYLRAQAREKLFYVRPGEKTLLVLPNPNATASTTGSQPAAAPDRWYDTLWHSVRAADEESQN